MNIDKATPELFAALAKAQGELENASKNSANPHFRSKYADLAEVLNTIRPSLSKHGIALIQSTSFEGELVSVTTVITHSSGGSVSSTASCVPAKVDAQGIGAATTYLRRYSLAAMCGIAQEDDDGNAAAHNTPPARPSPEVQKWLQAIEEADASQLDDIAAELAKSNLSTADKSRLRAAFAMRQKAVRAA